MELYWYVYCDSWDALSLKCRLQVRPWALIRYEDDTLLSSLLPDFYSQSEDSCALNLYTPAPAAPASPLFFGLKSLVLPS